MIIGVLSDSHSNGRTLRAAAEILQRRQVTTAVHCGDICNPESVAILGGITMHWVFGNCDFDRDGLRHAMARAGHRCHGLAGKLRLGGCRLAFTHGHRSQLLDELITSGSHEFVCHGHTHQTRDQSINGVRVLNPGALSHAQPTTVLLLDLETGQTEWVVL